MSELTLLLRTMPALYDVSHMLISAGLVLIVWGLGRCARLRPVTLHALWLVVMLRFVVPAGILPNPPLSKVWTYLSSVTPDVRAMQEYPRHPDGVETRPSDWSFVEIAPGTSQIQRAKMTSDGGAPRPVRSPWADFAEQTARAIRELPSSIHHVSASAGVIWVIGSLGALACSLRTILRFQRGLATAVPAPAAIQRSADALARQLGLSPVPVVVSEQVLSPCVWCFGRLRICWPAHWDEPGVAMDATRSALMVHELAHIRRRDHWVAWLELVTHAIWWWNPCFRVARNQLRLSAELACDQWVVERLPEQRRQYAESLISLSHIRQFNFVPAFLGTSRVSGQNLQRRLTMIMACRNWSARLGYGWITALAVAVVICPNWQLIDAAPQVTTQSPTAVVAGPNPPAATSPVDTADSPATAAATAAEPPAGQSPPAAPDRISEAETPDGTDQVDSSALLSEVLQHVESTYYEEVNGQQITRDVLARVLKELNPEAELFDAAAFSELQQQLGGTFVGIGTALQGSPAENPVIRVQEVLAGSPAEKAGVRPGDIIRGIDGRAVQDLVAESRLAETVRLIRGQTGTVVKLTLERPEVAGPMQLEVERRPLELRTVHGFSNAAGGEKYYCDRDRQVGYLRISNFAATTPAEFRSALNELTQSGIKSLVLDLRFNGGGMLDAVVAVADTILDDGTIVTVLPRDPAAAKTFAASAPAANESTVRGDLPIAVLVNSATASSAEILAACLQDHKRAKIVGERTQGVGLVKSISTLRDGSALKLPVAAIVRPNGNRLQRSPQATPADAWGVQPDAEGLVPLTAAEVEQLMQELAHRHLENHSPKFTDSQLRRAVELIAPKS